MSRISPSPIPSFVGDGGVAQRDGTCHSSFLVELGLESRFILFCSAVVF